jgi:hypothetical protein
VQQVGDHGAAPERGDDHGARPAILSDGGRPCNKIGHAQ